MSVPQDGQDELSLNLTNEEVDDALNFGMNFDDSGAGALRASFGTRSPSPSFSETGSFTSSTGSKRSRDEFNRRSSNGSGNHVNLEEQAAKRRASTGSVTWNSNGSAGGDVGLSAIQLDREREGRCPDCGLETHFMQRGENGFEKTPLNVEGEVLNGRCLFCHPLEEGEDKKNGANKKASEGSKGSSTGGQPKPKANSFHFDTDTNFHTPTEVQRTSFMQNTQTPVSTPAQSRSTPSSRQSQKLDSKQGRKHSWKEHVKMICGKDENGLLIQNSKALSKAFATSFSETGDVDNTSQTGSQYSRSSQVSDGMGRLGMAMAMATGMGMSCAETMTPQNQMAMAPNPNQMNMAMGANQNLMVMAAGMGMNNTETMTPIQSQMVIAAKAMGMNFSEKMTGSNQNQMQNQNNQMHSENNQMHKQISKSHSQNNQVHRQNSKSSHPQKRSPLGLDPPSSTPMSQSSNSGNNLSGNLVSNNSPAGASDRDGDVPPHVRLAHNKLPSSIYHHHLFPMSKETETAYIEKTLAYLESGGGDIVDVVSAMRRFPFSLPIQTLCCEKLYVHCFDNDHAHAIVLVGGIRTVIDAMENHSKDVALQRGCAGIIKHMACASKYNLEMLDQLGATRVLVKAMEQNPTCAPLLESCCWALGTIVRGQPPDVRMRVAKAGGVHAAMNAVEQFPRNESLLRASFHCLQQLGYDPSTYNSTMSQLQQQQQQNPSPQQQQQSQNPSPQQQQQQQQQLQSPSPQQQIQNQMMQQQQQQQQKIQHLQQLEKVMSQNRGNPQMQMNQNQNQQQLQRMMSQNKEINQMKMNQAQQQQFQRMMNQNNEMQQMQIRQSQQQQQQLLNRQRQQQMLAMSQNSGHPNDDMMNGTGMNGQMMANMRMNMMGNMHSSQSIMGNMGNSQSLMGSSQSLMGNSQSLLGNNNNSMTMQNDGGNLMSNNGNRRRM